MIIQLEGPWQEVVNNFIFKYRVFKRRKILDHFGYKCSSHEEYESIKKLFMPQSIEPMALWIHEYWLSGRRVSCISLKDPYIPMMALANKFYYLELQDQKPDGSQISGVDHVEIVLTKKEKDKVVFLCKEQGVPIQENAHPHHNTTDLIFPGCTIKISLQPLVKTIFAGIITK